MGGVVVFEKIKIKLVLYFMGSSYVFVSSISFNFSFEELVYDGLSISSVYLVLVVSSIVFYDFRKFIVKKIVLMMVKIIKVFKNRFFWW